MQRVAQMLRRELQHSLAAYAVAALGLLATIGIFLFSQHLDEQRIHTTLKFRAEWRASDIESKLSLTTAPVSAMAAFIASQEVALPGEYGDFARRLVGGESSMRALSWAPLVLHADRGMHEQTTSAALGLSYGIRDMTVTGNLAPAGIRPEYAPITLTELFEAQTPQHGHDLLQDPTRDPMLRLAREQGRMVAAFAIGATAPTLVEPVRHVVAPVFASIGAGGDAVSGSRLQAGDLRGFVLGHSRISLILEQAIADTPEIVEHIRFYVEDRDGSRQRRLVAMFDPAIKQVQVAGIDTWLPQPGALEFARDFDDLGQRWTLVFSFPPAVIAGFQSNMPWLSGLLCLLLTLILTLYFMHQKALHQHVAQAVTERTRELSAANAALASEVDERSKVEKTLRRQARTIETALAALPVAICFIDTGRRIQFWSKTAQRLFGYSAKQVMGQPYTLSTPETMAEAEACFSRIEAGELVPNIDLHCRHRDGRVLNVSLSGAPLYEDDKLLGTLAVLEDVTQRRQVESQLFQAQKMDALGQLTGGLAHDFNNLLLVVMGNTQLLRDMRAADETVQKFGAEIATAAERGAELVRSMLAFARRQPLRPQAVDINATVSATTSMLRRVLGERVEVILSLASESWLVNVDPIQLETALANLATNARDAMPRGGRLTIRTLRRHLDRAYTAQYADVRDGDYMMLEVSDTGIGMAPDLIKRIFEPFFTTKEAGRGSGLGLSMVFGFIKQSGGHLNVYSEPGVGTTFRLYLPRHPGDKQMAVIAEDVTERGSNETVLAVEDDPGIRKLVQHELEMLGYRAIVVENAANALALLESGETVDLLFSDVVMAGKLDGLELAHLVQRNWPGIAIVLTSGFSDTNIGDNGRPAHDFRLLSKPYRRQEMAQILREALREAAASRSSKGA